MTPPIRVLLVADTHLGFDDSPRPRVQRRRRGRDFFARFEDALRPALRGEVDFVVHGGDLLYRARVPASLVQRAMAPLMRVANRGVPVFVVPGNHERSRIPFPLLTLHHHVHVFHAPRTVSIQIRGVRVAVSGFPFARVVDAEAFPRIVDATGWRAHRADVRVLCMHQAVEGAVVGVQDFTFRRGRDVIPGASIPRAFAAVLSGHIHRGQVLDHDLAGRPLAAPVVYPGSVERTAFAERRETKGYSVLLFRGGRSGGRMVDSRFVPLAARPMHVIELDVNALGAGDVRRRVTSLLRARHPDSVVRLITTGDPAPGAERVLCAAGLRELAPATMNVCYGRPSAVRQRGEALRAAH